MAHKTFLTRMIKDGILGSKSFLVLMILSTTFCVDAHEHEDRIFKYVSNIEIAKSFLMMDEWDLENWKKAEFYYHITFELDTNFRTSENEESYFLPEGSLKMRVSKIQYPGAFEDLRNGKGSEEFKGLYSDSVFLAESAGIVFRKLESEDNAKQRPFKSSIPIWRSENFLIKPVEGELSGYQNSGEKRTFTELEVSLDFCQKYNEINENREGFIFVLNKHRCPKFILNFTSEKLMSLENPHKVRICDKNGKQIYILSCENEVSNLLYLIALFLKEEGLKSGSKP